MNNKLLFLDLMSYLLFTIFFLVAELGFSQVNKSIFKPYFKTADSIVTFFYGKPNFDAFIKLDSSKSEYLILHNNWGKKAKFNKSLDFKPNVFQFQYLFTHPIFSQDTLIINFIIDSSKQLMIGMNPIGLFNCKNFKNLDFISKETALKIAKRKKIKNPLKNYSVQLGWEAIHGNYQKYQQTGDLRKIVKGKIVWKVESIYRNSPSEMDEMPYAETFIIDALNGKLLFKSYSFLDWD